jgi:hypothetical protein
VREVTLLSGLNHVYVVRYYQVGRASALFSISPGQLLAHYSAHPISTVSLRPLLASKGVD